MRKRGRKRERSKGKPKKGKERERRGEKKRLSNGNPNYAGKRKRRTYRGKTLTHFKNQFFRVLTVVQGIGGISGVLGRRFDPWPGTEG